MPFSISSLSSGGSANEASPTVRGIVFGRTDALSGNENVSIGYASNVNSSPGSGNVAIGSEALRYSNGSNIVAIGKQAAGAEGVNIGFGSVAVGYSALFRGAGGGNIAIGRFSAAAITTGQNNTIVGNIAGYTGTNDLSSGSNNILIGNSAIASSSTVSNEITLGNSSITTLRAQVTSITSLSDVRDKKNIEPLSTGLNFVNSLNPVKFDWNMRDGGKVDVPDTGFIAQDLIELEDSTGIADYLKLTFRDNPDKLEASYGRLVPILVKAIQDLSIKVNELEEKLNCINA